MDKQSERKKFILAVVDAEEIRDGIEILLKTDNYRVETARNEEEALIRILRQVPDVILVSLSASTTVATQTARSIRHKAGLPEENVPIVLFCVQTIPQGEELAVSNNVYFTHLDNFNQLRTFLVQLLA
jgi:CheY-like chemotaxis protein